MGILTQKVNAPHRGVGTVGNKSIALKAMMIDGAQAVIVGRIVIGPMLVHREAGRRNGSRMSP